MKPADSPYVLNGGDRMNKWCDHVLDGWRKSLEGGKTIKSDTGMENQHIKNHEKDGRVFTNYTKEKLEELLGSFDQIDILQIIESLDVRDGRSGEGWISGLVRKRDINVS